MPKFKKSKLVHGNGIYDLLISLIFTLSPYQAERLYSEILPRYSKRAKVKCYNPSLEADANGRIRLTEIQYKSIRAKYGDSYTKKAFLELNNYIEYLEKNQEGDSRNVSKLNKLRTGTHNLLFTEGWVYEKCNGLVVMDRPQLEVNPYLINDMDTAREYIRSIPKEIRHTAFDVKSLLMKFPELVNEGLMDDNFTG